jgi:hypothetical protein
VLHPDVQAAYQFLVTGELMPQKDALDHLDALVAAAEAIVEENRDHLEQPEGQDDVEMGAEVENAEIEVVVGAV